MSAPALPTPPDRHVRVRFAPAPSGDLHVGNVRTALYNWAFARHHGGTFVLRVEDTDTSRATEEGYRGVLDVLRWLGLDWDEGPEVGGPHGPYRQSERLDVFGAAAERLREQGDAYRCYCSKEELAGRAEQARREGRPPGYDNRCRTLSAEQVAAYEAEGRRPVLRFRMPPGSTTIADLVRGEVSWDHATIPDFTLVRSDGHPLYMLAASVDDVAMEITHIIRGEDLLSSVPKQIALYRALGRPAADTPAFGHLPLITGEDGKPLSKRNGEVSIAYYRRGGYLPAALTNYLALLGFSMPGGEERFSLEELVAAFDIGRVSRNPARFDLKKLDALNGERIRALPPAEFERRMLAVLHEAGLIADPPTGEQARLVRGALPLVQERLNRLGEAVDMLRFLFVPEENFAVDPQATAKVLTPAAEPVLVAAIKALADVQPYEGPAIEAALRWALVERLGLKPKIAFAPVRVAVTGRQVSPPLFESLELLGRERSVGRLESALAGLGA